MKTNQRGIDLLKSYEGLRLKAYLCPAQIPTIGYGATTYEDGSKVTLKDTLITVQRAEDILKHHLRTFETAVDSSISASLNENQFSALVSLCYNIGPGNFKKSTLVMLIEKGDLQGAADQFLVWNKGGGVILEGLLKRRKAERALFLTPVARLPAGPSNDEIRVKLQEIEEGILK